MLQISLVQPDGLHLSKSEIGPVTARARIHAPWNCFRTPITQEHKPAVLTLDILRHSPAQPHSLGHPFFSSAGLRGLLRPDGNDAIAMGREGDIELFACPS